MLWVIWSQRLNTSQADEDRLIGDVRDGVSRKYRNLIKVARRGRRQGAAKHRRALVRLRCELQRIGQRAHFPADLTDEADDLRLLEHESSVYDRLHASCRREGHVA